MKPDYTPQNVDDDQIDQQYHDFVRAIESSLSTLYTSLVLGNADSPQHLYKLHLDNYYNDLFYERLKIVGGAFSVLEEVSKQALLLFRKDHNSSPDVKDSDFIWFPYEANEAKYFEGSIAVVIDRLFLTTRQSQKINKNAPDFLRFIERKNYDLACLTNKVTEHHSTPVLYCDNSEILIFLLCYLELLERSGMVGTQQPRWPENSPEAVSLLDHDKPDSDHLDTVHRTFIKYTQTDKILRSGNLYRDLGITDINGHPSSLFNALKQRLERCDAEEKMRGCELRLSGVRDISHAIDLLLVTLFNITENTYEGSLRKLHLLARFPIIPYLEILLKRKEKIGIGHLVFPVWKSYSFAPEVQIEEEKRKEYNVVFALLTVDDALYGDSAFGAKFNKLSRIIRRLGQITADMVFYKKLAHKRVQQQATRAAISQVLARNMSHNIGSHVSYRATNTQVKKRARELYPTIDPTSHVFADWLDYFGDKLDKYEIYRNEYLSDFDLSPKSIMFYRDLILPFCENMFVMDNIAAGEGLNYEGLKTNRLKIKCRINGEEIKAKYPELECLAPDEANSSLIVYPDDFPYLLKNKLFNEAKPYENKLEAAINNKEIIGAKDLEICIHSEQAVYSILENFIRNSAKHKPDGSAPELILCLDLVKKKGDKDYTLYLYDNTSRAKRGALFNKNEPQGIYQKIEQTLLDPQGKPRRANWGYADMKINSFLLWNDIDDLDDSRLSENFKLITINENSTEFIRVKEEVAESEDDKAELRFGYELMLSAARKILWIGKFEPKSKAEFEKEGLVVLNRLSDSTEEIEGLSSFQFAVIDGEFNYEDYLENEENLPGRVILLNAKNIKRPKPSVLIPSVNDIPKDNVHNMLRWCWQQWLTRDEQQINLYLYFGNDQVADQWDIITDTLNQRLRFKSVNSIVEREQELLKNEYINIIYNHHGGAFGTSTAKPLPRLRCETNNKGNEVMNFAKKHSIVFFDKSSEDFAPLHYPPSNNDEKELMVYQLMDAATTNVFIIDERILDYARNPHPTEFEMKGVDIGSVDLGEQNWNMYAAGKVFVIHEIQNGDIVRAIGKIQDQKEKLSLVIDSDSIKLSSTIQNLENVDNDIRKDILIIHRTYLDGKRIGVDPKEFLKIAKRQFGSVFITSGGGYPPNLVGCRFISFSALESCVNTRLSKNKLNNILRTNVS